MPKGYVEEQGIPVGNVYDKYGTRNPIARHLVGQFLGNVLELVKTTGARDVHELGCGEGKLTQLIADLGVESVRGSDLSAQMIEQARAENRRPNVEFAQRNLYELSSDDAASLLVCCEVLEHLEDPRKALEAIRGLCRDYCLFSVPREPLWRIMNVARGKYLKDLGNTPGHLQHWGRRGFSRLINEYFEIVETRSPIPWTIVLCRPKQESRS